MITRVLELMTESGMLTKRQLAEQTGLQPETLDDILGLLLSRGLIRESGSCQMSEACASCPVSRSCDIESPTTRTFILTKRGKEFLSMRKRQAQRQRASRATGGSTG